MALYRTNKGVLEKTCPETGEFVVCDQNELDGKEVITFFGVEKVFLAPSGSPDDWSIDIVRFDRVEKS